MRDVEGGEETKRTTSRFEGDEVDDTSGDELSVIGIVRLVIVNRQACLNHYNRISTKLLPPSSFPPRHKGPPPPPRQTQLIHTNNMSRRLTETDEESRLTLRTSPRGASTTRAVSARGPCCFGRRTSSWCTSTFTLHSIKESSVSCSKRESRRLARSFPSPLGLPFLLLGRAR